MEEAQLKLYAVGDVGVIQERPEPVFSRVSHILRQADILFGNLEAPISDKGKAGLSRGHEPSTAPRSFPLRSEPSTLSFFKEANFHVLSLANNHAMDFGPDALLDCIGRLEQAGIRHVGAGEDLQEALRPVILERNGIRVGFLAFNAFFKGLGRIESSVIAGPQSPGIAPVRVSPYFAPPHVAWQDLDEMQRAIDKLAGQVDHVFVSCHWGAGFCYELTEHQRAIGRAAIEAGAALVIGHHPHILQGIERYQRGLICYSLGEFGFDLPYNVPGSHETILLQCNFSQRALERVTFLPAVMDEYFVPRFVEPHSTTGTKIVNVMQQLSTPLDTEIVCGDGEVRIELESR